MSPSGLDSMETIHQLGSCSSGAVPLALLLDASGTQAALPAGLQRRPGGVLGLACAQAVCRRPHSTVGPRRARRSRHARLPLSPPAGRRLGPAALVHAAQSQQQLQQRALPLATSRAASLGRCCSCALLTCSCPSAPPPPSLQQIKTLSPPHSLAPLCVPAARQSPPHPQSLPSLPAPPLQMAWTLWSASCAACACLAASPTLRSPPRRSQLPRRRARQRLLLPARQPEQRLKGRLLRLLRGQPARQWRRMLGRRRATRRLAWTSRRQLSRRWAATWPWLPRQRQQPLLLAARRLRRALPPPRRQRQRRRRLRLRRRASSSSRRASSRRTQLQRRKKKRRWLLRTQRLRGTWWSV